MTNLELVCEAYPDEEFLSADGFDEAIIGVNRDKITGVYRLVYSQLLCIETLMTRDEMSEEEAIEHFDFNVEGAYVGEKTPIWVDDLMFFID